MDIQVDDQIDEDYGQEQAELYDENGIPKVQVANPVMKEKAYQPVQDPEQVAQQDQADDQQDLNDDEQEEIQAEHTPSFFSQRFAGELLGRNQDDLIENNENVNFLNNSLINRFEQKQDDCKLNMSTIQMKQLLGQEKMAPELLPYQHALVESICREINAKDREITQRMENKKQSGQDERFYLNINRMEIERTKYTLKSYLRCRMIKIEKHLLYIVEKDQAHLLSPSEMEYAWTLYEAKKEHFNSEFFEKVSKKLNCMDEGQDIQDQMITKPNQQQFVYVRFLINLESHELMEGITVQIKEDNIYFMPFATIKSFLEQGQAELV